MKTLFAPLVIAGFASGFFLTTPCQSRFPAPTVADPGSSGNFVQGHTPTSRVSGEIHAPLRWALLESTNYHEYIANLRAVGCPEGTIHDITRSVVESAYAPRFAGLDHPGKFTADVAARVRSKVRDQALLRKDIDRLLY